MIRTLHYLAECPEWLYNVGQNLTSVMAPIGSVLLMKLKNFLTLETD
jgi:hypothetical protein